MKSFHRRLVLIAILCLAGLLGACGSQTQEPAPAEAGQTESETAQPTKTELSGESPLPTPTDAPEAQTGMQPVSPIPMEITTVETAARTGEVPQDLLQAVIEDLLGRLDATRDAIAVEEAGAVTWRDGSLGCPQPGMMYAQVLTPGYRIVLKAEGEVYEYRTAREQYVILCGDDGPTGLPLFPLDPGEIKDGKPWMPVDGEAP